MAQEANNNVYVNDYNYDMAIMAVSNRQGDGRLGWVKYAEKQCVVSTKEHKFQMGNNNEHQAGALTLVAQRLAFVSQNEDIKGKNILLVVPDSIAPRLFEAKGVINNMRGESYDAVAHALVEKLVKDWMSQQWVEAISAFSVAISAAICEGGANVDTIKRSELTERTLQDCFDVKAGDKVTVLQGGYIEGHEGARTSSYVKPGVYTVIDRSYQAKEGVVPQFTVSRWENSKAGARVGTLLNLKEGLDEVLPKEEALKVSFEA
jgi:hypothetical protein